MHTVLRASKIGIYGLSLLALSGCLSHARFSSLEPINRTYISSDQSSKDAALERIRSLEKTPRYYLVKPGDTLYSIAFRFGLDYRKLAYANKIDQRYRIYEGQSLELKESGKPPKPVKPVTVTPPKNRPNTTNSQVPKSTTKPSRQIIDDGSAAKTSTTKDSQGWKWPHNGKIVRTFSSGVSGSKGIDLEGRIGDSVFAAANGVVVYAGNGLPGYGNLVILEHLNGLLSAYAFNERILVKEKDKVGSGQKIATMGKQGDQPGLHFEIRQKGKPIDPLRYLPKR